MVVVTGVLGVFAQGYIFTILTLEHLGAGPLLLSPEESVEGDVGDLADLEPDSGDISHSVALTSESRHQNLQSISIYKISQHIICCLTSSFSSTKLRQPSLGTKAVIFLPFLMSCTLTHFLIAELGCLASTPTFSRTMPLA